MTRYSTIEDLNELEDAIHIVIETCIESHKVTPEDILLGIEPDRLGVALARPGQKIDGIDYYPVRDLVRPYTPETPDIIDPEAVAELASRYIKVVE